MTTAELVKSIWMLWKEGEENAFSSCFRDFFAYGRKKGWLEDQDERGQETPVNRMTAARILHGFLRKELGEPDESDWRGAEHLKDIYDCHTCVGHVAQMYAKGIMEAENQVFGMQRLLTSKEAALYLARVFGTADRLNPGPLRTEEEEIENGRELQEKKTQEKKTQESKIESKSQILVKDKNTVVRRFETVPYEEALQLLRMYPQAVLLDVRTQAEYEKDGLPGARHVPLLSILEHPEKMEAYLDIPIILYCDQGERSKIAAECLLQSGYQQVFVLLR